jgi:transketolase
MSDAECNEGSVWEAAMFASHHRLSNLFVIVDQNGQQALGKTRDIVDLEPMVDRWRAFGWDAREVDGHDVRVLGTSLADSSGPRAIIARTIFGRGVSFMEGVLRWHYMPMTDDEYRLATEEIEAHARRPD